ncbi:c-type cytochrome [Sphingobium algorifonticola]|uniref:Cytochrome c family protein n=1 Tax=Sphingobium algorifonticola TaxID=2008318 RepID=A0A437J8E8_9SPHN|nr:cytochrome c family protein [Sphingobium algorifonticola]RVT41779.1 cytochrome c family protein [Sphingobium algorifonticola]
MDDRFNTMAGWALFAGIIALGGTIVSGKIFHGGRPEKMGYAIEGVEAEGGAGADEGPGIATLLASADVAAGEKVFGKCAACHTVNQGGANGIGPNLYGIVGKPHASIAGFAYSDALKSVSGNWTFEALDAWLKSPRAYADGTKMTFAGLGNGVDRANVIAYLNAQGSNLPLPAAEAAPAEAAANAAEPAANAAEPAANAAE